jgi:glycosyltransferase involved in cell wall biosynthesis
MLSAIWTCLWLARPDVVIATSPQFFCGWAGVWVSRLKRRPFVLEIRDIWPESISAVGALSSRRLLQFLEWLERRMYRAADHIVAVGAGYRDRILEKADVQDRISVIMNGVDLKKFSAESADGGDAIRTEWGLRNRFICSYVGTLGMAHGLEVVVEAASQLKAQQRENVAFCLIGDGARREELERLARERNVTDMVVFAGRQPREMMPSVLSASDACLVHLRATELFGTVIPSKIFETMAMARPIIMGVQGEALALVQEAGAGIPMEPESATSLVAAMDRLSEDRSLRQTMGEAGRRYVSEHFDRDQLAAEYLALLSDLVEPVAVTRDPARPTPVGVGAESDLTRS